MNKQMSVQQYDRLAETFDVVKWDEAPDAFAVRGVNSTVLRDILVEAGAVFARAPEIRRKFANPRERRPGVAVAPDWVWFWPEVFVPPSRRSTRRDGHGDR